MARKTRSSGSSRPRRGRVAVYVRLSRETTSSTSVERQRELCEAKARQRFGPDVAVEFFEDVDVSGYDRQAVRPEFDRLLGELDRFDAVVAYRLDRLGRRAAKLHDLVARLDEAGASLLVATQEELDTSGVAGKVLLAVLAALAEVESDQLSERAVATREHLLRTGRYGGGPVPFGYRLVEHPDGRGQALGLEPDEAAVVREAAARVLSGEGYTRVARDLTERGEPSPSGRGWPTPTLRDVLTRPVVAGYQSDDGQLVFDADGEPVRLVVGEPVLDPEEWREVVAVFERRRGGRPSRERGMLAGLIVCGECGTLMGLNRTVNSGRGGYRCPAKSRDPQAGCPGNAASRRPVEDVVLGYVEAVLPRVLELGRDAAAQQERDRASENPVSARLAHLAELQRGLLREREELTFDEGLRFEAPEVKELSRQLERARTERDKLLAELQRVRESDGARQLRSLLGDAEQAVAAFEGLDDRRRHVVLDLLLERVVIHKASQRGPRFDPDRVEMVPVARNA